MTKRDVKETDLVPGVRMLAGSDNHPVMFVGRSITGHFVVQDSRHPYKVIENLCPFELSIQAST